MKVCLQWNMSYGMEYIFRINIFSAVALNKFYLMIIIPPGIVGNILSFLVRYKILRFSTTDQKF